jgi:hypothetical protein
MKGILVSLSLILILEAVGAILTLVLFLKFVDAAVISIASMIIAKRMSLTAILLGCQTSLAFWGSTRRQGNPEL